MSLHTNFMSEGIQVIFYKVTAVGSKKNKETRGIPKRNEMRFSRKEFHIQDTEVANLLSSCLRSFYAFSEVWPNFCIN